MSKQNSEQDIINQYRANIEKIENDYSALIKRERSLDEERENIFSFRRAFREYIDDANNWYDYPLEAKQLEEIMAEHRLLIEFEEGMEMDIRQAEQRNEEKYEELQSEKKSLQVKEDLETEEYQKQLRNLQKRNTI